MKLQNVYAPGKPFFTVLPPPVIAERAPSTSDINYSQGQIWYFKTSQIFYIYFGGGLWTSFGTSSGDISGVLGTANQINSSVVAGVATLSIPSTFIAPGSIASTTTISSGTTMTAGTGFTATAGNITATAGNLVATVGNLALNGVAGKLVINASAPTTASVGTTVAMTTGAVTVTTSACTTSSIINYSRKTLGGTAGNVSITAQPGGSFTLTSDSSSETSTFNYQIIN